MMGGDCGGGVGVNNNAMVLHKMMGAKRDCTCGEEVGRKGEGARHVTEESDGRREAVIETMTHSSVSSPLFIHCSGFREHE